MHLIIVKNPKEIASFVSKTIITLIQKKPNAILGLDTGATLGLVYEQLVKDHIDNRTNWSQITTFNLDEYINLEDSNPQSYRYFMNQKLFNNININKKNTYMPVGVGDINKNIEKYEELLEKFGPIDLQLLSLNENGQIGFIKPKAKVTNKTRVVNLENSAIEKNQIFFESKDQIPSQAITMGLDTLFKTNTLLLIASGEKKAAAIKSLIHGEKEFAWLYAYLKNHKNIIVMVDQAAAKLLEQPPVEKGA